MDETQRLTIQMKEAANFFSFVSVHYILQGGFDHKLLSLAGRTVIYSPLN